MRKFFTRRVHSSWLIAFACVSILLGAALEPALGWYWVAALSWLLTGVGLVVFGVARQQVLMIPIVVVGGLLLGLWRGSLEHNQLTVYEKLYDHRVELTGTVRDDQDVDRKGHTVVVLKDISFGKNKLTGAVWVTLEKNDKIQRSDRVTVVGVVQKGFGTFAGSMYVPKLVSLERSVPGDSALSVRNWFADAVRQAVPDPEASLGIGYLVGQRRALPEQLDNDLRIAGLMHVVVASGYNLTILVRLARRLFEKISKYLSALASGTMIASFVAITGASPSMNRAGLVAGLSLLAWYYGRKFQPLVLLAIAAATTVLINPSYVWGDVGWQLSFAAFGGVMLLAPLLQRYYFGDKKPGIARQILGETISAWLCTLPILLYTFGTMSNVAIIANLLILPLVPLAMLLTFVAGIGALAIPVVATVLGYPAYLLLSYMTQTAHRTASLDWAQTDVVINEWQVLLMYGAIVMFGVYLYWKTRLDLREANIVE